MEPASRDLQTAAAKQHLELELHRLNFFAFTNSSYNVHGVMHKVIALERSENGALPAIT